MSTLATTSPAGFVDFKEIKSLVTFSQVLEKYGILESLNQQGDRLSGPCPIHQGSNVTQFRVSVSKNCFNCFGACGRGGNVIDFVSLMEQVSFRDAALLLKAWFVSERASDQKSESKERSFEPKALVKESDVNPPLTFQLKNLDSKHSYLLDRGTSEEAINHFGLGFCKRGCLKDHVVIPIHNRTSELIGYVGRWPGKVSGSTSKYRFPKGFRKSLELFNLHRALQESPEHPLILVEGFFDCIALWEAGIWKCASLMGSHLSESQEALLISSLSEGSTIELLFDRDEAGERCTEQVSEILSSRFEVRSIQLPEVGMQPDHLEAESLTQLFE